jgi:hypothetical protein
MGFFDSFVRRVMDAAKGRLNKDDSSRLKRMFDNTKRRNTILAKGILSALKAGKASPKDIQIFANMLDNANGRIANGKAPFSSSDEKELRGIFMRAGISEKAARWFSLQMDEFLNSEIEESVREKTPSISLPKKTVKLDFTQKKQKMGV